jgi:hypothetical protein
MARGSATAFGCGVLLLLAGGAAAEDVRFAASASGDQTIPISASAAIGDARMIYTEATGTFLVDVKIRGMSVAEVTGAHIHAAAPGANGPIIFNIGTAFSAVPDGIELSLFSQPFPPTNVGELYAGNTYLSVSTTTFPSGAIRGQLLPLERRANTLVTFTVGGTVSHEQSLVALADGGFDSIWGGTGNTVSGRRFSATGSLQGATFTLGVGGYPDAAPLPAGFVAVWQALPGTDVVERRFTASGAPLTPQVTVATSAIDEQSAVASAPDGRFVVVWSDGIGNSDLYAQRFDSAGNPSGPAIQVTASPTIDEQSPDVAMAPDGSFLVTWCYFQTPDAYVQARAFNGAGTGGSVFAVNDGIIPAAIPHLAADSSGEYVVVWSENENANRGRRFSSAGAPIGASFPLDAGGPRKSPEVSRGADGEFVIALETDSDVLVRRFARDGSPASAETRASALTFADGNSRSPRVAIGPRGEAWVVWRTENDELYCGRITARQGYWSANEGHGVRVDDRAGNSDDVGTRFGAGWGSGISGTGLALDGVDTFVRLFSGGDMDIAGDAVTVTAWVTIPALPSTIDEPFHSILDSANDSFVLYLDKGSAELRFKATNAAPEAQRPGIPEALLRVNDWMFIAGVYDGPAGQARIYLDGQLVDTHTFAATGVPINLPAGVLSIGRDGANFQYFFEGSIEEVEVWDRVATPAELLAEVNRRFSDDFESGTLLAWSARLP